MKPYGTIVGHLLRLCRVILIVQVVIVAAAGPACAGGKAAPKSGAVSVARPAVDLPTRKAFTHFYSMEYDQAIRDFEQVVQSHPEDPSAVNHLASAVLYKELYRIGALDTELFANDGFLDSRHFPVDPAVRQRVRELTERSIRLSDERLKANPDDVVALYARGVARGTRAVATGMLDKSWFAALRSAVGARRDHERVLSLEPGNTDAKMIVGVHNYVLGSLSWAVKAAASVIGLGGSKQKGIQYLYEAAN